MIRRRAFRRWVLTTGIIWLGIAAWLCRDNGAMSTVCVFAMLVLFGLAAFMWPEDWT